MMMENNTDRAESSSSSRKRSAPGEPLAEDPRFIATSRTYDDDNALFYEPGWCAAKTCSMQRAWSLQLAPLFGSNTVCGHHLVAIRVAIEKWTAYCRRKRLYPDTADAEREADERAGFSFSSAARLDRLRNLLYDKLYFGFAAVQCQRPVNEDFLPTDAHRAWCRDEPFSECKKYACYAAIILCELDLKEVKSLFPLPPPSRSVDIVEFFDFVAVRAALEKALDRLTTFIAPSYKSLSAGGRNALKRKFGPDLTF